MPYEDLWVKARCDECKKPNWIHEGDWSDLTSPDTEAIECWNCQHKWWRDPDLAEMMYGNETDNESNLNDVAIKGQEFPLN